jgi:hypothetical protein
MGLVGYYNIFIEGLSKIAHPITSLQNKGTKFVWTTKCKENFNFLKELLTSAPILKIVDPNENLWFVQMHAKKDLVNSSIKMYMSLVMSPKILRSMRGNVPHMICSLLP